MVPSRFTNGGLMMKSGFTPLQRKRVYFNVCVTSRFLSSFFIYFWGHLSYVRLTLFLFSASFYIPRSYINVWWDRDYLRQTSLVMCMAILLRFSSDALVVIIILNTLYGIKLAHKTCPWDTIT